MWRPSFAKPSWQNKMRINMSKQKEKKTHRHLCKNSEKVFNESKKLLVLCVMVGNSPLIAFFFCIRLTHTCFSNWRRNSTIFFFDFNFLCKWLVHIRRLEYEKCVLFNRKLNINAWDFQEYVREEKNKTDYWQGVSVSAYRTIFMHFKQTLLIKYYLRIAYNVGIIWIEQ